MDVRRTDEPPEEPQEHESGWGPLLALGFILLLVVGGIFLARALHHASQVQDCVMQGRTNCAPLNIPGADR